MSKAVEYFENMQKIMSRILSEQIDNIEKAARAVADTLENGGRIHAFGTGHSHMLAEEIFYRAGGLVNVNPILESGLMLHESASKSTALERLEGYGEIIFDFNNINEKDVLFLFSNSGRNGVAIDLALIAKEKGVYLNIFQQTMVSSQFQKLQEIINSGIIGDPIQINLRYTGYAYRYDWQTAQSWGGGDLYNTGPHGIGQALTLLDFDPNYKVAFSELRHIHSAGDGDDYAKVIFTAPGKPVIDL